MTTVDVSIVIPARNAAATLVETLDSIAMQTVAPAAVIVVDDRSDDDTAKIADNHRECTALVRGKGIGPAAAVNLGFRQVTTEWMMQLDADDLYPPDRIEVMLETVSDGAVDAAIGQVDTFPDPNIPSNEIARINFKNEVHKGLLPGGYIMRSSVFQALGGYDEEQRTGMFLDFWDRFQHEGYIHGETDAIVLRRRIRPGTLSHRIGEHKKVVDRDTLLAVHKALQRRKSQE